MMDQPTQSTNVSIGLKFGLIAGLIYCLSLFVRYNFASENLIMLSLVALLFYLIIMGVLVFCGLTRRKEFGGYIELKDAFQTIFIAILISELFYTVFNFIYLRFIDPGYFDKMKTTVEQFLEETIKDDSKRDEAINRLNDRFDKQKAWALGFKGMFLGYLMWIAITGIFGLIISLIIRKSKPVFEQMN
jgi:hypothetical protein